jgi:glucan phosphoethanolaminetransferase (alkaline phosphatase superfamily)
LVIITLIIITVFILLTLSKDWFRSSRLNLDLFWLLVLCFSFGFICNGNGYSAKFKDMCAKEMPMNKNRNKGEV